MKKIFTIIVFLFISTFLSAQQQIVVEKRMYQDSTGKLFMNKSLPVYIKISQSPEPDAEHKMLLSEATPQYANPMYLANEGKNIIYSPSAVDTVTKKTVVPKQNVVFELYADSRPPKTTIINNVTAYEKEDSLFFGKDLKVWFTAQDGLSGLENIYLSINNQNFQEYLYDTLTFEQSTYYTLQYYSTDLVGNVEEIQSVSFFIDSTRPLTNLVVEGDFDNNIVAGNCTVTLKPKDAFSGSATTYYYIDNNEKKIYTKPIIVGNLREGRHTLKYFTEDKVNNIENEKSYEFFVDKTPPMIIDEVIGDFIFINGKSYTSGRSQMQLTALDNRAGVKNIYYSFGDNNWKLYETPFDLPNDKKNIKVYYYAEDNVNNMTERDLNKLTVKKFFISELDLEEPNLSHSFDGPTQVVFDTTYISAKTNIIIKATDNQSGVSNINYEINANLNQEYTDKFSIPDQGVYKITTYAFDKVNNVGSHSFVVKVDTTAPDIFYNFSNKALVLDNINTYPVGTKIFVGASDNATGVEKITYQLNNNSPIIYRSFINLSKKGLYEIRIEATDKLGNNRVEKFSFQVK